MKRIDFIKTLGIFAGSGMIIPEIKSEKLVLPAKNSNADMSIGVNGVERMRITSSGNVSIGTTTPSTRLVIS
jgi:hypothetical protein